VIKRSVAILLIFATVLCGSAKRLNDKVMNRAYADHRAWHLGFSVGVHTQSLSFSHTGLVTDQGETWFVEQPSYSPGFCVNGLIDLRLNSYFNVRFTPGLYFGNKVLRIHDTTAGATETQNVKSTLVVLPFDLKFSSMRYRNSRPYVTAGVMPTFDVSKRRSDIFQFNVADCFLTVGFGCDFYLPFFKLIPEVKFCFGLTDLLRHDRPDLADDPSMLKYTQSVRRAASKMFVLTFYFE